MLGRMTDSWLQAAKNDWKYPVTREWIALAHLFDQRSPKKAKPYPTPWPDENVGRIGGKKAQTRAHVLKHLRRMNPKENDG